MCAVRALLRISTCPLNRELVAWYSHSGCEVERASDLPESLLAYGTSELVVAWVRGVVALHWV